MVDASVGGKNRVDLGNIKNQIGVFNLPVMVLVDTQYLESLQKKRNAFWSAEMLKHGLIYDKSYWEQFLDLTAIDFADFDELIYQSVVIKK
jgi:3-dehydroquinate synthase